MGGGWKEFIATLENRVFCCEPWRNRPVRSCKLKRIFKCSSDSQSIIQVELVELEELKERQRSEEVCLKQLAMLMYIFYCQFCSCNAGIYSNV